MNMSIKDEKRKGGNIRRGWEGQRYQALPEHESLGKVVGKGAER